MVDSLAEAPDLLLTVGFAYDVQLRMYTPLISKIRSLGDGGCGLGRD